MNSCGGREARGSDEQKDFHRYLGHGSDGVKKYAEDAGMPPVPGLGSVCRQVASHLRSPLSGGFGLPFWL